MTEKYHYTKKTGRPTSFNAETFDQKLKEYLKSQKDESKVVTGSRGAVGLRFKVKLPTIPGFCRHIGITKMTLYNWQGWEPTPEKPDESTLDKEIRQEKLKQKEAAEHAIEEILVEQYERLINMGLAGYYNPTLAKLILSANHGMSEEINTKVTGELTNKFDDQQIDRIAERIASRSGSHGDTSGEEKSN